MTVDTPGYWRKGTEAGSRTHGSYSASLIGPRVSLRLDCVPNHGSLTMYFVLNCISVSLGRISRIIA